MKILGDKLSIILFAAIIVIATSCSVLPPQEDHTRYFTLVPTGGDGSVAQTSSAAGSPNLSIGLGPISLPRYLQRPEVITRVGDTEFAVSDNDRWGEPLDANVSRVLAQDLGSDLPNSQIVPFPWSKKSTIDYRVSVDFSRLERTSDGRTVVQAAWSIRSGKDNQFLRAGTTTAVGSAGGDERSASTALSQGIGQVSREIAQTIQAQGHG